MSHRCDYRRPLSAREGGPCWGLYLVLIETESQLLSVAHIRIEGIRPNEALFISLPLSVLSLSAPQRIVALLSSPLKFMKRRIIFLVSVTQGFFPLMPAGWLSSVRCRVSVLLKQSDLVLYWLPCEGDALVPAEDDLLTAESQALWQDLSSKFNIWFELLGSVLFSFFFSLGGVPTSVEKIIPHYWVPCMLLFCPFFRQLPSQSAASPSWPLC